MKIKNIFLFIIIISLIFTVSCAKECRKALDCEQKTCFFSSCVNGVCNYKPKDDCCGNGIKDKIEDGEPGNECTCPFDYGTCSGNKGEYLEKYCVDNECVWSVSADKIQNLVFSEDKTLNIFDIELLTKYDEPFVIGSSNFVLKITLKDDDEKLIYPIVFTKFRLFEKNLLLGERTTRPKLYRVGDSLEVIVPFDFSMNEAEEEKSVTLKVDYEYTKSTTHGNELYRDDFTESYRDKFIFVNPLI